MVIDAFIEQSYYAQGKEELLIFFEKAIGQLGFDKFIYTFMTEQPMIREDARHGVVRSYPDDWMKHYVANEYMHIDPTYKLALQQSGAFSWKQIEKTIPLSKKSLIMMREAEEASIKCGASVSIHGINHDVVGFGFASAEKDLDINPCNLYKLHALAHQFHLKYCEMFTTNHNKIFADEIKLTEKEREILLWCSRGKSNGVIADILKISENTVNFHMKNIFKKLQVNDRTLAVLCAYKKRIITL